ncbi:MAG: potassium-transporting ATPase subunit A, partial [Verrucomicrobiales bacterium]|nr:potassium-transporting ATPase subunit A [Verrucomicrobiales bacterium]
MNQPEAWLQIGLFVAVLAAAIKPLGLYLGRVLDPHGRTLLSPVLRPLEDLSFRLLGVRRGDETTAARYTGSLLLFSAITALFTYGVLRCQHLLPLNPEHLGPVDPALAFNTAVSFCTNTDWQSYAGESTLSYFSQMVGLTLHQFTSAAVGICVAAALVRGLARSGSRTLGCFWVDLVRVTHHLLLPASLLLAVFLVSQGTLQNFQPYLEVPASESTLLPAQRIAQGPMASQVAIKMLGTNGGGFMNANAAHPYENATPLSNFVQTLAIFLIGGALVYHLGHATGNPQHGWTVWITMMLLFLVALVACGWAESQGIASHQALGITPADGNLEGKEVRFGLLSSSLFAVTTTAASCGAVNAMHDSFTALGGLVLLFNMQLGEIVVGGVGSGLYGMVVFIIVAVFIAGLMVGRTPEYLGKKIEAFEIKMAMLVLLA